MAKYVISRSFARKTALDGTEHFSVNGKMYTLKFDKTGRAWTDEDDIANYYRRRCHAFDPNMENSQGLGGSGGAVYSVGELNDKG